MQGFNMGRYYPPDAVNPPVFNASSHPLGTRASKISEGILTVRFELPFAVWCDHCKPSAIVGQGVRFNAEKKKVGKYYSTPIWSFRMKHSACGGWWEIRTDPKNAAYVVIEGARKRDYGPDDQDTEVDNELKFLTAEEKERRRNDAFANLEGKMEDKGTERKTKERVEELYDKNTVWRDPYDVNARLRKSFRDKRALWKEEERQQEGMRNRYSLGIEIDKETEVDRVRAGIVDFISSGANRKDTEEHVWKPLFQDVDAGKSIGSELSNRKIKSEPSTRKIRQTLQQVLVNNTKAAIDPFVTNHTITKSNPSLGILKRKRSIDTQTATTTSIPLVKTEVTKQSNLNASGVKNAVSCPTLVDYDSE